VFKECQHNNPLRFLFRRFDCVPGYGIRQVFLFIYLFGVRSDYL
jgi:hypothetical protein